MTFRLFKPRRIFSVESIQTQLDHFGEQLEAVVSDIVTEIKDGGNKPITLSIKDPRILKMTDMIFQRTGMKVDIITNELLAAILPFYSNKNHIFIPEFFRGELNIREQNKLLSSFKDSKGTVNLEKAKVSGIYSEYEHPFYVNFNELVINHDFNAALITACMLHELGHGFDACYFADRTDTTNQVMANIARNLLGDEHGDVEYIYKELVKISPSATKATVDKMVNGPRVVAGATWFKEVVKVVYSQTVNSKYNETSFEQGADSFASRFGYGKQLIIALDKLHRYSPEKSKGMRVFVQLTAAAATIVLASLIFSLLSAGAIGVALVAMFYKFIFLSAFREDFKDYTYDELKQRYLRIRSDVVDQLKNTKLPKDTVNALLSDLYTMDTCIKETAKIKTMPGYISNFIFSGARAAEDSINDQQLMEALASNDLFIHAAALRQG